MKQRTNEWHQARLGKLTASRFDDIVKLDGTLRSGERPSNYMNEKIFEILNNKPFEIVANTAMQWGTDHEEEARIAYEEETFSSVEEVGFIISKEYDYIGCSSDGLIDDVGGIEIKCPYSPTNHIATLISKEIPNRYKAQVQGNIWINELEWMDYVSYDPRMNDERAIMIIRCYPEEEYINNLEESLCQFDMELQSKIIKIRNVQYQPSGE